MAKTITITSRHDLGIDGAKRNITARYEALKTAYVDRIGRSDLSWTGDVGNGWATFPSRTCASTSRCRCCSSPLPAFSRA